jgi:(2R)-ethylmalonyl-CoA mutase
MTVSDAVEYEQIEKLKAWRASRDAKAVTAALKNLESAARENRNIMEPSIACAKAQVTTGEWGETLRRVFGEYRAPTGVTLLMRGEASQSIADVRQAVEALARKLGTTPKFLVGKPGLDGHSNGAEQIAVRAADCGFEVCYDGIRLTPEQIVSAAIQQKVHVVGLSILSGSHVPLVRDVMNRMRSAGLGRVPVVAGGIIPSEDALVLKQLGVAQVYTPKDFDLNRIMTDLVRLIDASESERAA